MENNTEITETQSNNADTGIDSSQSHVYVNPPQRIKQGNLRSTKSSPHRNVELHHTRSFSEICHLHPSSTDISTVTTFCPRPRAIEELQHEVRRPESVLEMADLPTSSEDESDEDAIATEQQKGDEAMKIFLESNVSIPLDGNLTSSSLSQDTLDSEFASESELFVGNWERQGRDSIASTGLEKRFLTPSGQLLYREHQVDSLLDTKRLKLTPSTSDRPMSPLAKRRSAERLKDKSKKGGRRYREDSDSESDDFNEGMKIKNRECDCDLRLQDLKNVIRKYERQCEELINRNKEQYEEIKTLRKDNVNMRKEQNRLQVLIREFYQNEDSLKGSLASISQEKEEKISKLGQRVRDLGNNVQDKNSEISKLQNTIDDYQKQGGKYIQVMLEINNEIEALFEALSRELGFDNKFEVDIEENPEAMVTLLKTRRESLSGDFKNFYENLHQETENDMVGDIQTRMKEDFQQLTSGHKDTISKIHKAERDIGGVLKRSASLETLLKETKGKYNLEEVTGVQFKRAEFEVKIAELQGMNDSLTQENKVLQDECSRWKKRCEEVSKRNTKRAAERKRREEKPLASVELGKLQKYLKQRRRSYSESQLTSLQGCKVNFARAEKPIAETTKGEQKTGNFEGNSKDKATSTTVARHFEGLSDLESRLKQLSQLTEDLNAKIEKSNRCLVEKSPSSESEKKQDLRNNHDQTLSAFYGYKLFSVIKGIYDANVAALQESIQSREQECCLLKERLLIKESNEEVTQCYVESLKRAAAGCQENVRNVKNKNQVLKRELRVLRDRVLVTNAEREMSVFYCKKNGVANGVFVKHEESSDVETSEEGHQENGFGMIGEGNYFKKQIKHSEV